MGNSEKTVEIKNNSERNIRYDFIKGILMFGVVIGHMITTLRAGDETGNVFIHVFIRTYDMPLFMLVSGYFLKLTYQKYNNFKNIINKFTSIIVPLLLWNTLFYIIEIPLNGFSIKNYIGSLTTLWFLWATFICTTITLVICQVTKNTKIRILAMIIISMATLFLPKDKFNIAYVLPFFFIGFFFDEYEKISKEKKTVINFVSICAFIILLCFWKTDYNIWNAGSFILTNTKYTLFAIFIRFFIALFGSITIITLCDICCNLNNKVSNKIVAMFANMGKNTLGLYILHAFLLVTCMSFVVKRVVAKIGVNYFTLNLNLLGFVIAPVLSFIAMIIINIMIEYLKKIPKIGKYLFGFKVVDARIKK